MLAPVTSFSQRYFNCMPKTIPSTFLHADTTDPAHMARCECGEPAVYEAWIKLKRAICRGCLRDEGYPKNATHCFLPEPPDDD